jgi:transcriptional regulator with PAS, ATPase and Fis domain
LNSLHLTEQEKRIIQYLLKVSGHPDIPDDEIYEETFSNTFFVYALKLLNSLLNSPYEKVIITDRDGRILFLNEAYANKIAVHSAEVIGKNVLTVLGQDTRMHIVGKTLKPELHGLFHTANTQAVARRIPLITNGEVLGVMGKDLFDNMHDLFAVAKQAQASNKSASFPVLKSFLREAKYTFDQILTQDPGMIKVKKLAQNAAATTSTILIQGETGVGKELFAHAIHQYSKRRREPFVSLNCAAIPETLLESELFGYEKGSFTGASREGKPGKFELADGGTIFLDEIGDIPLNAQVKILRVLQEKEIERVGGTKTVPVDVRVIASTNKDLWQLTQTGAFRADLYYRLHVVPLLIPALRERLGDIPILVTHFIEKFNQAFSLSVNTVSKKSMKMLKRYHWPGNVRELESVIESAMNHIGHGENVLDDFPPLQANKDNATIQLTLKEYLERQEAEMLLFTLSQNDWNIDQTAKALDISHASLYRKITKYKIN